jgi:hypothetical protein
MHDRVRYGHSGSRLAEQTTAHLRFRFWFCRTGLFQPLDTGALPRGMRPAACGCVLVLFSTRCLAFTCQDGSKTILDARVNDNYCDCDDGSDETTTPACAGQHGARYSNNLLSMCDPSICCNLAYLYTRSSAVASSCYALQDYLCVHTAYCL